MPSYSSCDAFVVRKNTRKCRSPQVELGTRTTSLSFHVVRSDGLVVFRGEFPSSGGLLMNSLTVQKLILGIRFIYRHLSSDHFFVSFQRRRPFHWSHRSSMAMISNSLGKRTHTIDIGAVIDRLRYYLSGWHHGSAASPPAIDRSRPQGLSFWFLSTVRANFYSSEIYSPPTAMTMARGMWVIRTSCTGCSSLSWYKYSTRNSNSV